MSIDFARIALSCALASSAWGCATARSTQAQRTGGPRAASPAGVDLRVDPCTDFHAYACGDWLARTPVPARGSVHVYDALHRGTHAAIAEILRAAQQRPDDPLGRYHRACMDVDGITRRGVRALQQLLRAIEGASDHSAIWRVVAGLHRAGVEVFAGLEFHPTYDRPDVVALWLWQSPYATNEDDLHALQDVGVVITDAELRAVHAVDRDLAEIAAPRGELRHTERRHHPIDLAGLAEHAPDIDWSSWRVAIGLSEHAPGNLAPDTYFAALGRTLARHDVETLRAYLRVRLLASYAADLRALHDREARAQLCIAAARRDLGAEIDRRYVEATPRTAEIEAAHEIFRRVSAGFGHRLDHARWLDETTRTRAHEKLAAVRVYIGAPPAEPNAIAFAIADDHIANVMAAREAELARGLHELGKPVVDRWSSTVSVASSSNARNRIVMPAAYIQPPHFDPSASVAAQYGAMGTTFGHEIVHLFDDQGRRFDAAGRLHPWWDDAAIERFEARAECVRAQYDEYVVAPGVHIDGRLTLGENLAELGGVQAAHVAFAGWAVEHGVSLDRAAADGCSTPDQDFFVAFARTQCSRWAADAREATMNVHPPGPIRINGTLANVPAFHEAFACEPGTPMHPNELCEVW